MTIDETVDDPMIVGDIEEPEYESLETTDEFTYPKGDVEGSIEEQSTSPEALCSASIDLYGQNGSRVMFTVRGPHPVETLNRLNNGVLYAASTYGLKPAVVAARVSATEQAKPFFTASQHGAAEEQQDGVIQKGSGSLTQIVVRLDENGTIVVDFQVVGLKYVLSDHRGAETVVGLFDPSIGFKASHFASPRVFTEKNWKQPIVADWIKKAKNKKFFYDVVHVRPVK